MSTISSNGSTQANSGNLTIANVVVPDNSWIVGCYFIDGAVTAVAWDGNALDALHVWGRITNTAEDARWQPFGKFFASGGTGDLVVTVGAVNSAVCYVVVSECRSGSQVATASDYADAAYANVTSYAGGLVIAMAGGVDGGDFTWNNADGELDTEDNAPGRIETAWANGDGLTTTIWADGNTEAFREGTVIALEPFPIGGGPRWWMFEDWKSRAKNISKNLSPVDRIWKECDWLWKRNRMLRGLAI